MADRAPMEDGLHPSKDSTGADDAIDDSDFLDDEFVEVKKTISDSRRQKAKQSAENRIQEILPFQFLPNIRPLTVSDLESVVVLENAAFTDPEHRCTREKFEYRLSNCPELCMGLFCTVSPSSAKGWEIDTWKTAHAVETGRSDGSRSVLLAHIVGTRIDGKVITDKNMAYPHDFRTSKSNKSDLGHQEQGRAVAIHSLAVHPKLQGCGLGSLIMKSYMQQINNSGTADRISLISQGYLVNYYVRFGFTHLGASQAEFGGGGWHDLTIELRGPPSKK